MKQRILGVAAPVLLLLGLTFALAPQAAGTDVGPLSAPVTLRSDPPIACATTKWYPGTSDQHKPSSDIYLPFSTTNHWWYTFGAYHHHLKTGNCGHLYVKFFYLYGAASDTQSQRMTFRGRTYNSDGTLRHAGDFGPCLYPGEWWDARPAGEVDTGREFRLDARACDSFYNNNNILPSFRITAGNRV